MTDLPSLDDCNIAILGLGYVGLPLAVHFAYKSTYCKKKCIDLSHNVLGFDINQSRIDELMSGYDRTQECKDVDFRTLSNLSLTSDNNKLASSDVFIITVPTPIDDSKRPDLRPLQKASQSVGEALRLRQIIKPDISAVVIYESTVFPGATRDVCVPILERFSGLTLNSDFYCGYSPERINPGDSDKTLSSIVKVTSGSTPHSGEWIDKLYSSIISAGTHMAPSIEVAESAKVIENTQRDLNIALINELAIIFDKLNLDTHDILEAAATKWNFLNFKPGLVGGHCIGVDPYYLTYKAESSGYYPHVVLAGRRINDGMGQWVVERLVLEFAKNNLTVGSSNILILGFTFKENCPDIRNTRVIDIYNNLLKYNSNPFVVDPIANSSEALATYSIPLHNEFPPGIRFDAVILAVAHHKFADIGKDFWRDLLKPNGIVFDLKNFLPREIVDIRL